MLLWRPFLFYGIFKAFLNLQVRKKTKILRSFLIWFLFLYTAFWSWFDRGENVQVLSHEIESVSYHMLFYFFCFSITRIQRWYTVQKICRAVENKEIHI